MLLDFLGLFAKSFPEEATKLSITPVIPDYYCNPLRNHELQMLTLFGTIVARHGMATYNMHIKPKLNGGLPKQS